MSSLRRYEILLPLLLNDGSPVSHDLLRLTFSELRKQFRAVSWETQTLQGSWEHEGVVYEDNLTRFYVDVPDTTDNRQFFVNYKSTLKIRFGQLDIWITSHPLDVI